MSCQRCLVILWFSWQISTHPIRLQDINMKWKLLKISPGPSDNTGSIDELLQPVERASLCERYDTQQHQISVSQPITSVAHTDWTWQHLLLLDDLLIGPVAGSSLDNAHIIYINKDIAAILLLWNWNQLVASYMIFSHERFPSVCSGGYNNRACVLQ